MERDREYGKYLKKHHLSDSTALRETFNAGWHSALAAVQAQYDESVDAANESFMCHTPIERG